MKSLINWFKVKTKMKRWLVVILIGMVLLCYGIAQILVQDTISFIDIAKVAAIFVVGFVTIVIGIISMHKRSLEIMVETSDERMGNKKNINVKSLIFNKTIYDKGPNIVVIGGGAGLNTVLSGMKKYTNNLTAIVSVSEYGEAPTESRREMNVLPLSDIRDSFVSLAQADKNMGELFNYKFQSGRLRGLEFTDIYFSAMKDINGDFEQSIISSDKILNITGKVMPVTLDEMKIVAELANGYVVEEKSRIPQVVSEKLTKINRIYLSPSNCKAAPGVVEAIKNADCIIIGPGSLYTNVIPNLLVNGVTKAIKESEAIKVYISNIMTEQGQTDDYSVSDHLNAIIEHCGQGIIDFCMYDTGEVIPEFVKKYNLGGQDLVEQNIERVKGIKFLQRNLSQINSDFVRHDSDLVAKSIIELICDDLKYQDKHKDPQFMMLNTKLEAEKKIRKTKKAMEKKSKLEAEGKLPKEKSKNRSKFKNKYSERIASIRTADSKAQKRKAIREAEQKVKNAKKTKFMDVKTREEIIKNRMSIQEKQIEKKHQTENFVNIEDTRITNQTMAKDRIKREALEKNLENIIKKSEEKIARPKSARGRKKTSEEIREEMLKKLNENKN